MEPMPVVLDISSDEEPALEEVPKSFDYDWIKEFLGVSDKESDDSDEVVIVREVKPERKSKSTRPTLQDLDEDCVVLDGDPENCVASVNDSATGSDDLLVVGEKGQVACRDYPHPRHLCAMFPFSSTPHEIHCDQCHCYVCDLLAPCLKWGTGISSTDHCHATEKAEIWKIQRKNFKMGKSVPLPASANNDLFPLGHPQHNQVRPLGIIRLSSNSIAQKQASRSTAIHTFSSLNPMQQYLDSQPTIMRACSSLNSTIQNHVSRSNTIPMCTSTTKFTVSNGPDHGRCQESESIFTRNRHQPHSAPRQFLGVRNNAFQRDRRHGACNLGPQFSRSHMMPKRVGSVGGTLSVNHSAHGSSGYSNHANPAEQFDKYHDATGLSNERTCNGGNNVWLPTNLSSYPLPSSAQPSLNCVSENAVASETQGYSQRSQLKNSQNVYQYCIQSNDAPSNYVACPSSKQHENEHQMGSQNENASENISQCGNPSQDACQQEPHEENQGDSAAKAVFSVFDLTWNENTSQSIEPLIESSHLQSTGSINEPPNVKESDTKFAGSTNPSSLVDFENWLMEKDGAWPSELNFPSADSTPVDTGTFLFDFDTSWNGLAHA